MTKVVEDDRARQAKPGRPVLYVLAASLFLAGIYVATMLGWSGMTSPPEPAGTQQTSPSSANSGNVPAGNPAYPAPAAPNAGTSGSQPAR